MGDRLLQYRARGTLQLEIAFERLFRVLSDQQLVQILQVRQPLEEQDALDQLVGVFHLVHRLSLLMLAQSLQSPVVEHPGVQEVLVDRGQLVREYGIEMLNDILVTFHTTSSRVGGMKDSTAR